MTQISKTLVIRQEICTEADIRRVAMMLDIMPEPVLAAGVLPRGWQFLLMRSESPSQSIRSDGFAGLGIALPDCPRSRVVLAGREVRFLAPIPIGTGVQRVSEIVDMSSKETDGGPLTFVKIAHQIRDPHSKAILLEEWQTYILMDKQYKETHGQEKIDLATCVTSTILTPTDLMLFQYSALCFNPHRIHYDRSFAKTIEGYPDLVVNGGLIALFVTEYLRNTQMTEPIRLKAKHRMPLFVGRSLTIAIMQKANNQTIHILNEAGHKAAEIEIEHA